ncbi:MAG TPA: hypothetical protein DIC34_09345 [Treponema sp.]|nr:MAG: hypothetical protein A2Y36_05270 [Treponema sp. GWA1_62_8]OHE64433.1 MAG: hypothetical protein A2001_02100 [Treponema sp. GWC1_61_84]OHE76328.1 MAG: hypothetical protein A2413_16255 [Treponema sp. RIFOXYC1_FULL_61_9]HCM26732.1 hypothetical protein [Treponema sp.]
MSARERRSAGPSNVFQLEMTDSLGNKRALALKLGLTLLMSLPFVLFALPPEAKVAGLIALLTFTSFFGATVGIARRRSDGRLGRLRNLPIGGFSIGTDLVLSSSAMDMLQMGMVLALYAWANGLPPSPALLLEIAAPLVQAVTLFNAAGLLVGLLLRDNKEAHLAGALCVGLLLVLSGQIPAPATAQAIMAPAIRLNPAFRLAQALLGAGKGLSPAPGLLGPMSLVVMAAALIQRSVDWRAVFGRR